MAYNEHWDACRLALRFDGLNGSQAIVDSKGNAVTVAGTAALSSAWADAGPTSLYLDGNFDNFPHIQVATSAAVSDFGTGALTIAVSFKMSNVTDPQKILWCYGEGNNGFELLVQNGWLKFYGGPWWDDLIFEIPGAVSANVPCRVMIVRNASNQWRLLIDGVYTATHTQSESYVFGDADAEIMVGARNDGIYNIRDGYVDEVYFVHGVALEWASYTPAPFFDAVSGSSTGVSALPISVSVKATGESRLPITVSVGQTGAASLGVSVSVLDAVYLTGSARAADGVSAAGLWSPVVFLGGIDVTSDVVGEITVEASEGAARIAGFDLQASGPLDLPGLTGKRVTIDIADASGGNGIRLFTGLVDVPAVDLVRRLVRITANDDLMNTVNAMDRAAIESLVGGRWSKVVFDDGAVPWSYAQDRLSTVAASLDMDATGALRLTPWAAKASADLSFDASVILEQSIAVDTAERGALVNDVMVSFGYRFPMAKREAYEIHFEFMANGFGPWVNDGNAFLVRSTVQSAIEAAGFAIDTLDFVPLPTTPQLIGGVAMWLPNPATDPLLALGFDATVTFDYTQSVQEQHAIRVYSQASLDAVGRLPASLSGALEGKTVDTVAAETAAVLYQNAISKIPSQLAAPTVAGSTTAAVMDLTADTNRAAAETAMETLIDVAKVKIAASHRSGRVSAALALHPLVDLDKTVAIDADGVQAKGKVVRVVHRMDADSAQALTEFEIAVARLDGSGLAHVDTSTTAPAGVADGVTATLAAPVCTFNGLSGQDQQFTITFPGVDSAERDLRTVDIASEYNVSIIEDDLVVTL